MPTRSGYLLRKRMQLKANDLDTILRAETNGKQDSFSFQSSSHTIKLRRIYNERARRYYKTLTVANRYDKNVSLSVLMKFS